MARPQVVKQKKWAATKLLNRSNSNNSFIQSCFTPTTQIEKITSKSAWSYATKNMSVLQPCGPSPQICMEPVRGLCRAVKRSGVKRQYVRSRRWLRILLKAGKKALHVLINALFCTFFWCSCCSGFREKVSALKGSGGGGTSCPQQWNISSVLRPLLTEGARCHTETEHLLHSNVLLPRSRNIRVEGRGILLLEMWYFLGWTVRNLEEVWWCVCLFVQVRSCT